MRAQQLVQDLRSLLGGRGAAGVSGVGEQKERKEEGSMKKRNEETRPMGKDRSGEGNEGSTLSTANVTTVLIKGDRKEGRVGELTTQPPPAWQCGWYTRAVQSWLGPWTIATLCQQWAPLDAATSSPPPWWQSSPVSGDSLHPQPSAIAPLATPLPRSCLLTCLCSSPRLRPYTEWFWHPSWEIWCLSRCPDIE